MNLTRIKARIRANTWEDTNDLSDTRLLEAINYIYTRRIPHLLNWKGLQAWGYVDLATGGDGNYSFLTEILDASGGSPYGARMRTVEPPIFLQVDSTSTEFLTYTYDRDKFWRLFPPLQSETEDRPTYVLLEAKYLHVRPVPDDTYVLAFLVNLRPTELSAGDDEPVEDWAEAIIDGATAILLGDDEEQDATMWWELFADKINCETSEEYSVRPRRTKGRW